MIKQKAIYRWENEQCIWIRFLLLFCRKNHAILPHPFHDSNLGILYPEKREYISKKLFKTHYMVKIIDHMGIPKHYNCRCITRPIKED